MSWHGKAAITTAYTVIQLKNEFLATDCAAMATAYTSMSRKNG